MQISKQLQLEAEKHETHGEIFVLYSLTGPDGVSAHFVETSEKKVEIKGRNKPMTKNVEIGMGLRLTRETAIKLAWQILKQVGSV